LRQRAGVDAASRLGAPRGLRHAKMGRRHDLRSCAVTSDEWIDRNVLGGPLESCSGDPLTGFYRDGCCRTGPEDLGSHTICAVVSAEFLEHQQSIGNDLSAPNPTYDFPGLEPG